MFNDFYACYTYHCIVVTEISLYIPFLWYLITEADVTTTVVPADAPTTAGVTDAPEDVASTTVPGI